MERHDTRKRANKQDTGLYGQSAPARLTAAPAMRGIRYPCLFIRPLLGRMQMQRQGVHTTLQLIRQNAIDLLMPLHRGKPVQGFADQGHLEM